MSPEEIEIAAKRAIASDYGAWLDHYSPASQYPEEIVESYLNSVPETWDKVSNDDIEALEDKVYELLPGAQVRVQVFWDE